MKTPQCPSMATPSPSSDTARLARRELSPSMTSPRSLRRIWVPSESGDLSEPDLGGAAGTGTAGIATVGQRKRRIHSTSTDSGDPLSHRTIPRRSAQRCRRPSTFVDTDAGSPLDAMTYPQHQSGTQALPASQSQETGLSTARPRSSNLGDNALSDQTSRTAHMR